MKATCLILAGGKGTRISSILGATPKCLATVNHRPFLRWQVSSLIMAGVDQIVLSLGHGANLVLEEIGKAWAKEININSVVEPEPLGTGGAIRYAWKFIENSEILILNGDTFLGNRLDGMFLPLEKSENNLMRMGLVRVKDGARFGAVETDQRGLVTGFSEKMVAGDVLVNAGIYRMHRDALRFNQLDKFSLENDLIPRLVLNRSVSSSFIEGPFIDIGTPDSLGQANAEWFRFTKNK